MGRPREFDTAVLLRQVGELFIQRGFTATSIDEIVNATGVVRASLYSIFGSKQRIFIAALELADRQLQDASSPNQQTAAGGQNADAMLLNLLNVAVFEVAPQNHEIAALVQRLINTHGITAATLGQRALKRAGLTEANTQLSKSKNSRG